MICNMHDGELPLHPSILEVITVVGVVVGNQLTPPSDLGDYDNLYKELTDVVPEWSDASMESCKEADTFSIDFSQQAACVEGNCRVAFILLYPIDLDFQSVSIILNNG